VRSWASTGSKEGRPDGGKVGQGNRREGGGSLEVDASPTYSPHGLPCFFLEQFCFSFGSISFSGDVKS
jgi:hypothetical protein